MHKHWLRYGTAAEQKHMIEYKDKYDGIVINASMLAHTSKSIAKFMHNEGNNKPYFIDPMTHAFQHDLEKIRNDKGNIKSSINKLIELYGDPIKSKIDIGQPVKKNDFNDTNISNFIEAVLNFQYEHIKASLDDELKPYIEFMNAGKKPEWLIAPYFYMTKLNYDYWFDLNEKLIRRSIEEYKDKFDLDIYAQLVIDKNLLLDTEKMAKILDSYSKADGLIYWIDNFDETSASIEELKSIFKFVSDYKSKNPQKSIYSLYGGYFSQLMLKKGLSGVVHGLEYGESRGVVPVGGGIPRSKFYLPALKKRIAGNIMASIVYFEAGSCEEYFTKICECDICKKNINDAPSRENVTHNFSNSYLSSKLVPIHYKDENRADRTVEFPLQESKIQCLYHYLEVKYKEFNDIEKLDVNQLLNNLKVAKNAFEKYFSLDEVSYLDKWIGVFTDE